MVRNLPFYPFRNPKCFSSVNHSDRHFWRLWTTFQKIPSYPSVKWRYCKLASKSMWELVNSLSTKINQSASKLTLSNLDVLKLQNAKLKTICWKHFISALLKVLFENSFKQTPEQFADISRFKVVICGTSIKEHSLYKFQDNDNQSLVQCHSRVTFFPP